MRTGKKELDVDFIGGVKPLTKQEEKIISEVINMLRAKMASPRNLKRKPKARKKISA